LQPVAQRHVRKNNFLKKYSRLHLALSVFGSVVAGTFQIAFRAEIHANDVFSFFKNHF